jgi:hypothetical protein
VSFEHDFDWQRGLIPEIKRILANYLICEAPPAEDMQRNTDLIVLKLDTVRVACRLRRYDYLAQYGDQFTIRTSRPSGVQTELSKMLAGWGDYIFYGFASPDGAELAAWVLGDLSVFRLWHHRELWDGRQPGEARKNGDGSSGFRAYRIADLPEQFVVSRKRPIRPQPSSTGV